MSPKPFSVLFDTNTWGRLVSSTPSNSLDNDTHLMLIKKAINEGLIIPFMSSAWFIEQIPPRIKCSLILTSVIPQKDNLDKIVSKFPYTYLKCNQQFFYIDKLRNEIIHFSSLRSHSLLVLAAKIVPPTTSMYWESDALTPWQLDHITSITGHRLPTRANVLSHLTPYPKLTKVAENKLIEAINLGFKLISTHRIGFGFRPVDLELYTGNKTEWPLIEQRIEQANGFILKKLKYAAGEKLIYEMANNIRQKANVSVYTNWPTTLRFANASETKKISEYIAELCDGDIIIGCYAYKIDYLCTKDSAKKKPTAKSVFSEENKKALQNGLGLNIVTPEELANIINQFI